jgi:hypothetical protein
LGSVRVEIASRDDFDSVVQPITHYFHLNRIISKISRNTNLSLVLHW